MRSVESRAAEAAIRFYRWAPPRTKRCPHNPGCSELALAAARDGGGVDEVLRIVSTCKTGEGRGVPVIAALPVLLALPAMGVARSSCPPMMQGRPARPSRMECMSVGPESPGCSPLDPCVSVGGQECFDLAVSKQWGRHTTPCVRSSVLEAAPGCFCMGGDPPPCEWVGPKGSVMMLLLSALMFKIGGPPRQWGGRARRLDHGTGC